MAEPTKFRNKWRIRWTEENGKRKIAVYSTHREASSQLKRFEAQVEEIKCGLRSPTPADRTFDELCTYPNEAGNMHQESARIFQETLHRVIDKAEFPKLLHKGKERRYIRFHDLRHTFASHWVMNGGDIFRLQKILGHKSIQMTQRYAHLAPDAFSGDYGRFGEAAPAFGEANVIPLKA